MIPEKYSEIPTPTIIPTPPDTVKKLKMILAIAFMSVIVVLLILLSLRNTHQPEVVNAPVEPPAIIFLSLKDQPYLQLGNAMFVPLKKKEWDTLTNAFPESLKKQTINFGK